MYVYIYIYIYIFKEKIKRKKDRIMLFRIFQLVASSAIHNKSKMLLC